MGISGILSQLAPEFILLVGACVALLSGLGRSRAARFVITPSIAFLTVVTALLATLALGNPDGSFARMGLWLTSLSYYARLIALLMALLVVLVNWHQPSEGEAGEYAAMILFSTLGICLTASANDLIVLFLAIELVSVPTYVLVALSREDERASEAGIKYFFLGALAAAILAYGFAFIYGAAGGTTMFQVVAGNGQSALPLAAGVNGFLLAGILLAIFGLGFKIASAPFHAYVADVYEGAAAPITGMLGFVPKFAGFIALIKLFSMLNWELPQPVSWLLWFMAAASMIAGNVLALLQNNVKRILAYSSISHTGYMLIPLLVGPVGGEGPMHNGITAVLFYIAVYGAMNLGAFAMLSAVRSEKGAVETLDDIGGLASRLPMAAFAFAVCVFSLMGLPPTAGFLGKLYVFSSALSLPAQHRFHQPMITLTIIGVLASAVGAVYYLRIVASAYLGAERVRWSSSGGAAVRYGLLFCAAPLLALFVRPAMLVERAELATIDISSAKPRHAGLVETDGAAMVTANVAPAASPAITSASP